MWNALHTIESITVMHYDSVKPGFLMPLGSRQKYWNFLSRLRTLKVWQITLVFEITFCGPVVCWIMNRKNIEYFPISLQSTLSPCM